MKGKKLLAVILLSLSFCLVVSGVGYVVVIQPERPVMNNEFLQILSLIFTAVTAAGALFAALGARSASRATLKASEGQIISQMTNIYGSPEMLRSMMCLIEWKETWGKSYEKIFGKLRDKDYDQVKKEDEARRRFVNYYEALKTMEKYKLLDKEIVNDLRSDELQRFYNNLVHPLCKVVKTKI